MDDPYSPPLGNHQRRYRSRLARLGWHGMCTYVRAEHRLALEHLRDEYRLPTLHDARAGHQVGDPGAGRDGTTSCVIDHRSLHPPLLLSVK